MPVCRLVAFRPRCIEWLGAESSYVGMPWAGSADSQGVDEMVSEGGGEDDEEEKDVLEATLSQLGMRSRYE